MKNLSIQEQFKDVKFELGNVLFYLFVGIYVLNAMSMFWMPVNDYDTMSSYLARIKLEEFGPLRDTATLDIQYLFPKFFDYLHAPFLKLGYLMTFPNFFLFSLVLFILIRQFPAKQAAWGLILLFFCPAVLMTIASAKNDISLGLLGFLAWYAIASYKESPFYVAISLSLIAMLIGTKWHGWVLAGPLSVYLLWNVILQKKAGLKKVLIAIPFIPLFAIFSSAQVYLTNYQEFGTLMPRPDYLKAHVNIVSNFVDVFVSSLLDTIDPPIHVMENILYNQVSTFDYGFNKHPESLLRGSSDFNACGILLLIEIVGAGIALFKRNIRFEVRVAALLTLLYFIVITCTFNYTTYRNRYYLASYVLGIIPMIALLAQTPPRRYSGLLVTIFIVFFSYAVLFNGERRLVGFQLNENGKTSPMHNTYKKLLYRDQLYFNMWTGYLNIFDFMQAHIKPNQSLMIINFAHDDVPFIYPLIKDRDRANTGIINVRDNPQSIIFTHPEQIKSDFVMTFRKPFNNQQYKLSYDHENKQCKEVCIYQHV
jgi:hypothetical protein